MGEYQCANCFGSFNLLRQLVEHRIKRHPPTPKPATPEPPEWKGETKLVRVTDVDGAEIPPEQTKLERLGTSSYRLAITLAATSGTVTATVASPLARALEDFTARRKAKRAAGWTEGEGHIWEDGKFDDGEFCELCGCKRGSYAGGMPCPNVDWLTRTEPLSRAMSTPLPHDPPMSARLMPWRGKEE